jgi:HEPN domain-containing protein
MMTDFGKIKISFALALLAMLFALHPFLDKVENLGFDYLGVQLKIVYAYMAMSGLLGLCVYCYAVALLSDKPHSFLERLGNYAYALAVLVAPLYAGLYLSTLLADVLDQTELAWAAPAVTLGLGIAWLLLSSVLAVLLRGRLGDRDRMAKIDQLAKQEVAALQHARDLYSGDHYDLSVIEAWKAIVARLRRSLLAHRYVPKTDGADHLVELARRKHLLSDPSYRLLKGMEQHLHIAMSSEPLPQDAAKQCLSAARHVLATIPVQKAAK